MKCLHVLSYLKLWKKVTDIIKTKTMNLNLFDIRKLMITLLMLSLLWLLMSCGTRKTQKSNVKEETKTEQSTTDKKDIEIKTDTKTVINDESSELEITPIDTSKVLIINGKTYKNAKVKITNRKTETKIDAKETVKDLSKSETKAIIAVKKQTRVKDTERKSNPFLPLLWLLIPATIYAVWKYKYKIFGLWV